MINKNLIRYLLAVFLFVVMFSNITLAQTSDGVFINDEGATNSPQLYVDNIKFINDEFNTGGNISGSFSIYNAGLQTASDAKYRIDLLLVDTDENNFVYPIEIIHRGDVMPLPVLKSGELNSQFSIKVPDTLPSGSKFAVGVVVLINNYEVAKEESLVEIGGNLVDFIQYTNAYLSIGEESFFTEEGPTVSENEIILLNVELVGEKSLTGVLPNLKIFSGPNTSGTLVSNSNLEIFDMTAQSVLSKEYNLPTDLDPAVYTGLLTFSKDSTQISSPLEIRYIIGENKGVELKPKIGTISFNEVNQKIIDKFIVSVSFDDIPVNSRLDANGNFIDSRAESVFIKNIEDLNADDFNNTTITGNYVLPDNMFFEIAILDKKTGKIIDAKSSQILDIQSDFEFDPIKNVSEIVISVNLKEDGEVIDTKQTDVLIKPIIKNKFVIIDIILKNPLAAGVVAFMVIVIVVGIAMIVSSIKRSRNLNNTFNQ